MGGGASASVPVLCRVAHHFDVAQHVVVDEPGVTRASGSLVFFSMSFRLGIRERH